MAHYPKSTRDRVADINIGMRVDRATSLVRDKSLFRVKGGRVLLTCLHGYVTTAMHATTQNVKIQHDATNGAATDICANTAFKSLAQFTHLSISGDKTDAFNTSTSAVEAMAYPVILGVGDIKLVRGQNVDGSLSWSVWYVPLDDGASIEVVPDP